MNKTYEEYLVSIKEIEEQVVEIQENIDKNDKKIDEFNTEVEALKKKYGFDRLNLNATCLKNEKKEKLEKLISIKLLIVFECINNFVYHKYFKHEHDAFEFLKNEFKIYKTSQNYDFYDFFELAEEEFRCYGDLCNLILNYCFPEMNRSYYDLSVTKGYYRDGKIREFELEVPITIVDDFEGFKSKIETLISEFDIAYEERIVEKQKAKAERKRLYEESRKKA